MRHPRCAAAAAITAAVLVAAIVGGSAGGRASAPQAAAKPESVTDQAAARRHVEAVVGRPARPGRDRDRQAIRISTPGQAHLHQQRSDVGAGGKTRRSWEHCDLVHRQLPSRSQGRHSHSPRAVLLRGCVGRHRPGALREAGWAPPDAVRRRGRQRRRAELEARGPGRIDLSGYSDRPPASRASAWSQKYSRPKILPLRTV